jgi:hypothetical protein
VICASAPVLKPLLSKIPFSLSSTLSGGISLRKKATGTGYGGSTKLSNTAVENSRIHASATNLSSKRKSEAIRAAPDLDHDQGRSYELKDWDEEREISSPDEHRDHTSTARSASDDAILRAQSNEESSKSGGLTKIWHKMKSRSDSEGSTSNEDMTITMTSEIELSHEPASAYASKRSSRQQEVYRQHRAMKEHKSPSPPQTHDNRKSYF